MIAEMMTPIAPSPPIIKPADRPVRRPNACESLPTNKAAPADPNVSKDEGIPAYASVPSICCARSAPTVTPAANPAPPKICEILTTNNVRLYNAFCFSMELMSLCSEAVWASNAFILSFCDIT